MTDTTPTYIRCASGNNSHTDVLLVRRGDTIRLLGHPEMEFTLADALDLAGQLARHAREDPSRDLLVESVCDQYRDRSRVGQAEYGAKMTRTDLSLVDWLAHLKSELMDAVLYVEASIRQLERFEDDGR